MPPHDRKNWIKAMRADAPWRVPTLTMPTLVPSVLENTKAAFKERLAQEEKLPGVSRIQIDFGDGVFVPNTILPVTEIDVLNPAIHFEAHLMVKSPQDFLDYQISGFKTIIVHYEAYASEAELLAALKSIADEGIEAGICINPETSVEVLLKFYPAIKHFQLMSIHPGFQGTTFLEETYGRIAKLRELIPNAIIEVDGGVNETNIRKIADAGADYIILGSAITRAPDMLQAYETMQSELIRAGI